MAISAKRNAVSRQLLATVKPLHNNVVPDYKVTPHFIQEPFPEDRGRHMECVEILLTLQDDNLPFEKHYLNVYRTKAGTLELEPQIRDAFSAVLLTTTYETC
jgi:hypothetical protein